MQLEPKFLITIDSKPGSIATKWKQWPLLNVESKSKKFLCRRSFAPLIFGAGYWQCPLQSNSFDVCGKMTKWSSHVWNRVLNGLENLYHSFKIWGRTNPQFDHVFHLSDMCSAQPFSHLQNLQILQNGGYVMWKNHCQIRIPYGPSRIKEMRHLKIWRKLTGCASVYIVAAGCQLVYQIFINE